MKGDMMQQLKKQNAELRAELQKMQETVMSQQFQIQNTQNYLRMEAMKMVMDNSNKFELEAAKELSDKIVKWCNDSLTETMNKAVEKVNADKKLKSV